MLFDSPQIFLDCVGFQQYYKPANCLTFGGPVPLFELAKVKQTTKQKQKTKKKKKKEKKKKRNSPTNFSDGKISLYKQQRMMSNLHGIFTSAFSRVYCDKFSYEKPSLNSKSPEPQLCGFFWFLIMYIHTALAQCPTFLLW